jgi:hypothetical protein
MDKRILVLGATAVTSAAAGLAAGYQLAKRRLTKEYVEKLEEDMAAYRWSYSELQKLKASKAPTIDEEMAKKGAREALSQMDEVPDVEEVVGEENMERFGVGSDDNSIVYIRNDKLDVAFEVVLDQRSYAQVVMGADPADPRVQKRSKQRQRMSADA